MRAAMNRIFTKLSLVLSLVAAFVVSGTAQAARRGNEGPHGGDAYAAEFVALGFEIANYLEKPEFFKLRNSVTLDVAKMQATISKTLVYSAEPEDVKVGDQIVDATNELGKPFKINRVNWRAASLYQKLKAILHEYLGEMEIELDTYETSSRFDAALMTLAARLVIERSPVIRYYGTAMASAPMNAISTRCNFEQPWTIEAKRMAASIAEERCKVERNSNCRAEGFIPREVPSKIMPGFTYCEITAITR